MFWEGRHFESRLLLKLGAGLSDHAHIYIERERERESERERAREREWHSSGTAIPLHTQATHLPPEFFGAWVLVDASISKHLDLF